MSADDYYSYHGGLIAAVRTAKAVRRAPMWGIAQTAVVL